MGARGQSDAPASSSACPRSSPPSSRPSLSSGELRAPCTCRQRCTVVRKCWTLLMIPFGDREVPRCLLSQIGETHSISEVRKDAHQTNLHPLASLEAEFDSHVRRGSLLPDIVRNTHSSKRRRVVTHAQDRYAVRIRSRKEERTREAGARGIEHVAFSVTNIYVTLCHPVTQCVTVLSVVRGGGGKVRSGRPARPRSICTTPRDPPSYVRPVCRQVDGEPVEKNGALSPKVV